MEDNFRISHITKKGLKDLVNMTRRLYESGAMKPGECALLMVVGAIADQMRQKNIDLDQELLERSLMSEIASFPGLTEELIRQTDKIVREGGLTTTTVDDILNGGIQ